MTAVSRVKDESGFVEELFIYQGGTVSSSNSFLAFALPLISCSRITNKIATATWLQWGWQTCDNARQATMTLVAVAGDIVTIMWLYQWAPDYWAWLTLNWYLDQHELLDVLEDLKTPWHYTTWDMKIGNHLINILDSRLRSQTDHCKQELLFYWWAVISDQHQQVSRCSGWLRLCMPGQRQKKVSECHWGFQAQRRDKSRATLQTVVETAHSLWFPCAGDWAALRSH